MFIAACVHYHTKLETSHIFNKRMGMEEKTATINERCLRDKRRWRHGKGAGLQMNHMFSELSHVHCTVPHVGHSRKTDNHSGATEVGWRELSLTKCRQDVETFYNIFLFVSLSFFCFEGKFLLSGPKLTVSLEIVSISYQSSCLLNANNARICNHNLLVWVLLPESWFGCVHLHHWIFVKTQNYHIHTLIHTEMSLL